MLLPARIRQERNHLVKGGFHTLQIQVDEQEMEGFGQGFIQPNDDFFDSNIHNNSNEMVTEKDLMEMGFEREYPLYKMGDITLYAYEDDDRLDVYYMVGKSLNDNSIRVRTIEQLKQLIDERKG